MYKLWKTNKHTILKLWTLIKNIIETQSTHKFPYNILFTFLMDRGRAPNGIGHLMILYIYICFGFIISNDFINLLVAVLHDVIRNRKQFFVKIQYGGWPPSWNCWLQSPPIKIQMSPLYSAWSKTPILTYYTAIQIGLYGIDSFAPIPLKI